jgi:hypothetical protein
MSTFTKNQTASYKGRDYRIIDIIGKQAFIFPLLPTPKERLAGAKTVALKNLEAK